MTVTDQTNDLSDADARILARQDVHEAIRAGQEPPLGKELGARYGRTSRWGQSQRSAAIAELDPAERQTVPRNGTETKPAARETVPRNVPPAHTAERKRSPAARTKATSTTLRRRVRAAAVTIVALVAAAGSYSHMHALALEAGEGAMAVVLPLSVDGLVVAATMTILSARRAERRAGALPWLALLLGLGASLAANVAAAEPTVVGRLVAAWPPVALALAFELLLRDER